MILHRIFAALAFALLAVPARAEPAGDAAAGARLYARECSFCHEIGADARHRTGPALNGVYGQAVAHHADYTYSRPLAQLGAEGQVWDAATLDAFLENPRGVAPGTRMSYRGVRDAARRADLLAYLRSHSSPEAAAPLPAAFTPPPAAIPALAGDPEYGEYLAQECVTCHARSGADTGIPAITGWPEAVFAAALHGYRSGQRPHQAMQMVAQRLDDEAIASLAAYFATLGN